MEKSIKNNNTLDSYLNVNTSNSTEKIKVEVNNDEDLQTETKKGLEKEYESKIVFPARELLFNTFNFNHWDKIKVAIIGQDRHPFKGQGMPKSLINIYKCLENDKKLNFKAPKHADLSKWAEQGVLFINKELPVTYKNNSHEKISGYSNFTDFVTNMISDRKEGIVFLIWGNIASTKKKYINETKHLIIESIHPSPLAASRGGDFTLSKQFSKANEYLVSKGKDPIDWSLPL